VDFSSIVAVIALLPSLLSAWYTFHAARAAKAQTDAAKQQAAAAKAQLSLDQDRRNDELARRRKEDEKAAQADLRVTTIWVRPILHRSCYTTTDLMWQARSHPAISTRMTASRRQTRRVGMNWRPRLDQNGPAVWWRTLA
jgi:hypothetical protein